MRLTTSRFCAIAAVFICCRTASAADDAYGITLSRPSEAGDVYGVHVTMEMSRNTTVTTPDTAPQVQQHSLNADLSGRIDVSTVDAAGHEVTFTITVEKFVIGANALEAVSAGAVIQVTRTIKDVQFKLRDGGQLSADAQEALQSIYPTLSENNVTDDDAYGSQTPRKVEDTWPINAAAAAKQASGYSLQIDPKNITGKTVLKDVTTIQDSKALHIVTHIAAKDVKVKVPAGMFLEAAEMTGEWDGVFPVDSKLRACESSTVVDMHLVMVKPETNLKIDGTIHRKLTQTITPIKK